MDLMNWMSNIKSIMAGSRMDQIFLKGLEDVRTIMYFDDMEEDTEDDTEDNNENKYEVNNTKDDNEVQSSRSD
jgi:hypothetical protein